MPPQIPAGLKPADIARFALRASQLEKIKPAVAYWCQLPEPHQDHTTNTRLQANTMSSTKSSPRAFIPTTTSAWPTRLH